MGIEIAALFGFVGTLHGLNTEAKIMPRDWHQAGLPEQMVAGPYPIAVRAIARAPSTQGQAPISPSHPSTVLRPIAKGTEDKLSGITKPLGFHLARRGAKLVFRIAPHSMRGYSLISNISTLNQLILSDTMYEQ
jgi:hypothetical protein